MALVATRMAKSSPKRPFNFVSVKIDAEVLKRAKAAAALDGKAVQEWASLIINQAAADALGMDPLEFADQEE